MGERTVEKKELVVNTDKFIEEHYSEELTLERLSKTLYLNASYLSRAYKKYTGYTITDRITEVRLERARQLLISTNMKVYQISESVGFNDPAYFTNVFVKNEGVNPTRYRQIEYKKRKTA